MPSQLISIPVDTPQLSANLIYLCKFIGTQNCGGLMYLQGIRSGVLTSLAKSSGLDNAEATAVAMTYRSMLSTFTIRLTSDIQGPVMAIVSPPSRFPFHAEPYRTTILAKFNDAIDLTDRFYRSDDKYSGNDASFDDIFSALSYQGKGDEANITSLLIVDDIFSRGRTAAAIALKLKAAGLPQSCTVTIACPLWLPRPGS